MRHGEGHGELRERAVDAGGELDELFDDLELGGIFGNRGIELGRPECGPAGRQIDGLTLAVVAGQESESAVAGEVSGSGENRVGDQEDRAAQAGRSAGPQNECRKGRRDRHGREFDGPEAEG